MSVQERFRTPVQIPPAGDRIGYRTPVLMLGSCFTLNIGRRMQEYKFPVCLNPFGVLYNPLSILSGLQLLLNPRTFTPGDLIHHQGLWHSFFHHSSFSSPEREQCLKTINREMKQAASFLKKARFLFISWGTARVYRYKKTGQIVSNCHKLPHREFDHFLLTPEEIAAAWNGMLATLNSRFPEMAVVFTVSPIRHWKDGAHGNQVSKSALHWALHLIMQKNPGIYYFPSYEIMMDELRDYRFYEEDMLHLSHTSISFIWERFAETYIDKEAIEIMSQVEKIITACRHRPIHPESKEYRAFVQNTLKQLRTLQKKYPFIPLGQEKAFLEKQIKEQEEQTI